MGTCLSGTTSLAFTRPSSVFHTNRNYISKRKIWLEKNLLKFLNEMSTEGTKIWFENKNLRKDLNKTKVEKRELSSLIHTARRTQALSRHRGSSSRVSDALYTLWHLHSHAHTTKWHTVKNYGKAVTIIVTQKGGGSRHDGTNNPSTLEAYTKITAYKAIPAHRDLVSKQHGRQHKLNRRPVIGAY